MCWLQCFAIYMSLHEACLFADSAAHFCLCCCCCCCCFLLFAGQHDIAGLYGAVPEETDAKVLNGIPAAQYNKMLQVSKAAGTKP